MTDCILLALLIGVMPLRVVCRNRCDTRTASLIHTLTAVIGGISAYRLAEGEHGRTMSDAMTGAAS